MKHRIPTWLVVAFGLALNILAALMTNFVIDDLGENASDLADAQSENTRLIQLSWQQIDGLERRREAIITTLSIYDAQDEQPATALSSALTQLCATRIMMICLTRCLLITLAKS
ncbi:hypothetical protein [Veronia nyctiphanis]|uniref:hypothetical protein n=1 Tax=Veronia nyctiphanis TaxID=1278244 RepID=UPI001F3C5878|nr:hypothetical protein [Veronia nyctiphanis]